MAGTVDSIRKQMDVMEAETAKLADEFQRLYENYLEALGKATRRQLILAGYQLCTQAYPEAFLRLSVSQRQRLQQALRELGDETRQQLVSLLQSFRLGEQPESSETAVEADAAIAQLDQSPAPAEIASLDTVPPDAAAPDTPAMDEGQPFEGEQPNEPPDFSAEDDEDASEEPSTPLAKALLVNAVIEAIEQAQAQEDDGRLTPTRLARQHLLLEQQLRNLLQGASKTANVLMQKAQVLPNLPEAILAAAAEADSAPGKSFSAPNLLNVLIEMDAGDEDLDEALDEDEEDEDEDEPFSELGEIDMRTMTHLMAIHLRVPDIEFSDTQAALWRSRLREALGKLKSLGKRYQKKQKELSVAEAEQAWRTVWFDDTARP